MRTLFLCFLALLPYFLFAQKSEKGSIWVMNDNIGIDFNNEKPKIFDVITPGDRGDLPIWSPIYNLRTSCFTKNKKYIYTQTYFCGYQNSHGGYHSEALGCNLRNESDEIIPNEDSLILSNMGSCLFVPINDSIVYFFTIGHRSAKLYERAGFTDSMWNYMLMNIIDPRVYYHKIVLGSDSIWRVTEKNIIAADVDVVYELAAVKHYNGKDW